MTKGQGKMVAKASKIAQKDFKIFNKRQIVILSGL
jgi:hypothetical protein